MGEDDGGLMTRGSFGPIMFEVRMIFLTHTYTAFDKTSDNNIN